MTGRIDALRSRLRSFFDPIDASRVLLAPETTRIGEVPHSGAILQGAARSTYVRGAILDYHRSLLADDPGAVQEKFAKMAESPFAFFRGSADLFYRDLAGTDANLPTVLANGDVHPANFSVAASGDGKLFFGLDDFDEAHTAPFTWDLRRGVTGLELAARAHGLDDAKRAEARSAFVSSYFDALSSFARSALEKTLRITVDDAPEPVKSLLIGAADRNRSDLLKKLTADGRFKADDELAPITDRIGEFQRAIDAFRGSASPFAPKRDGHFSVKDAAIKSGSGLGSVGLSRFFVLIEGNSKRLEDDVVLELKQERPSALAPYVSKNVLRFRSEGARVAAAEQLQRVYGDRYYGETTLDGKSYIVREVSPHKVKLDLDQLTPDQLIAYAGVMGRLVAQAHARADQETALGGQIEVRIAKSTSIERLSRDLSDFGVTAADRAERDHASFCESYP